jgi:hypothetical protein
VPDLLPSLMSSILPMQPFDREPSPTTLGSFDLAFTPDLEWGIYVNIGIFDFAFIPNLECRIDVNKFIVIITPNLEKGGCGLTINISIFDFTFATNLEWV